jgi:hypothetical protein
MFLFEYNAESTPTLPLLQVFRFYAFFELEEYEVNVCPHVSCLEPLEQISIKLGFGVFSESCMNSVLSTFLHVNLSLTSTSYLSKMYHHVKDSGMT